MDLSVVIPVFNEQEKIRDDIIAASEFLCGCGWRGEIIVVDDGSTDGTLETARATGVGKNVTLRTIKTENHRGKGHAVRTGILKATGKRIMFVDSGSCIPYSSISKGLEMLDTGDCLIIHGSRYQPQSMIINPMKTSRRLASRLFCLYIRFFVPVPKMLRDTQCGLKIYRGDVAHELYSECITEGFMFDIEIILRAGMRSYCIREFPVEWSSDPDSRLSPVAVIFSIFAELRKIRNALKT